MTPSERCDFLNNHADLTMPGLEIKFYPAAQQPLIVVSYIEISERIVIGAGEAKTEHILKRLFKERTNEALTQISKRALGLKIT